jgi:membrane associated rhomboid family serine protease
MGGLVDPEHPNQWWRFITPMFLHVGIIHFVLNVLFQLSSGIQVLLV